MNSSMLKLMMDYYSATTQINRAKRARKKVCAMSLPFGNELVIASGAIPISLYRLGKYDPKTERMLRALRVSNNFFGMGNVSRSLSLFNRTIGGKYMQEFADNLLDGLFNNYKKYVDIAADELYPLDACFGTRLLYGATIDWKDKIDFSFGTGIRCVWFSKHFELVSKDSHLIFMDIPTTVDDISHQYCVEEVKLTLEKLEKFMGTSISENKLLDSIKLSNKIREQFLRLIKIWANHSNVITPHSYIYLFSMIHFGFADHLADSKKYLRLVTEINNQLEKLAKVKNEETYLPKLMLVPMFGGFEPQLMKIVSDLGGRLSFLDWESLALLQNIKETGNIIDNYADYLLTFSRNFMNNSSLTKIWVDISKKYELDGVIFNSVYGCKSLTPASRVLKDELQKIDVPMLDLSFQNLDENLGQLVTRVGAFIEMLT